MDYIRARIAFAVYTEHALQKVLERNIDPAIIKEAVSSPDAEIIEDYSNDPRGTSYLLLGWWDERQPLHVVVGVEEGSPLAIITAYDPSIDAKRRWQSNFKKRRQSRRN
ncbi:MAG: DUF4258 domain-containing protein [Dehalococcoidia bacterium]|nr:DUF4258 domain-containing protein [Dehalococcoidia bacterium]